MNIQKNQQKNDSVNSNLQSTENDDISDSSYELEKNENKDKSFNKKIKKEQRTDDELQKQHQEADITNSSFEEGQEENSEIINENEIKDTQKKRKVSSDSKTPQNTNNSRRKKKKLSKKARKKRRARMKRKRFFAKYGAIINFFVKTAAIIGSLYVLLTFVFCVYRMDDNYMFPSIRDGDLAVFLRGDKCHSSDVILYEQDGKTRMGRIVAIENQKVEFLDTGGFLINEVPAIDEIPYETYKAEDSNVKYPVKIGDDQYFILNDFRSNTHDSRENGVIHKSQIKGKLLFLLRRRGF